MRPVPSRLRRLDGALADLPLEEPMLLTELDGFLTGILLCPEAVLPDEWMQSVWGSDESGVAAFEDALDVRWFADAVMARYHEIARDVGRGKPQPLFDIDERNGDVIWEGWIDGFAEAMALRPDGWAAWSALDSMQIDDFQDRAPAAIGDIVRRLHAAQARRGSTVQVSPADAKPAMTGRNEPCHCGSGKKFKRCCGS